LRDPGLGLREMLRVLKPGGTLLVAEPNNLANHAMFSSLSDRRPVEEMIQRLAFGLLVERGKQALGLGFNSVGDLIPGYLAELGARNVKVYLSDKAVPLFPPYAGREQEANIDLMREWASRRFIGWEQEEVSGYFLAGGGQEKDFDVSFDLFVNDLEEAVADIDKGTYHAAGGTVMYLIAAGKN
jgi:SAM-dependent methyltransferase